MKLLITSILLTCLVAPSAQLKMKIHDKTLRITSFKQGSVMCEVGGAIMVGGVRQLDPENLADLRFPDFWLNFFQDSVISKEPFGFMVVRAEVLLDDGEQILIDNYGRFIVLKKAVTSLDRYTGPVYELRASQFEPFLRNCIRT